MFVRTICFLIFDIIREINALPLGHTSAVLRKSIFLVNKINEIVEISYCSFPYISYLEHLVIMVLVIIMIKKS